MFLLAIDSSKEIQSASIFRNLEGQELVASFSQKDPNSRQQRSSHFLPQIIKLMDENRIRPQDLVSLAVSTGPGSFTGVRTALSISQTLASELNLMVFTANNFELARFKYSLEEKEPVILKAGALSNDTDFFISLNTEYENEKANFFSNEIDSLNLKKENALDLGDNPSELLGRYSYEYCIKSLDKLDTDAEGNLNWHSLPNIKKHDEINPYYLREPSVGKKH